MQSVSRFLILALIVASFAAEDANVYAADPPKVFLDKSPRIVAYQLKRLDNERLLMVPRSTEDPKYIPVYEAIVSRPAMQTGIRDESFQALAELKDTSIAAEVFTAISKSEPEDSETSRLVSVLTRVMLKRPTAELKSMSETFRSAITDEDPWLQSIAFSGLIAGGQSASKLAALADDESTTTALLESIAKLPGDATKNAERDFALASFEQDESVAIKNAAIAALSKIPGNANDTYRRLIPLVTDHNFRIAACRGLLRLPANVFETASAILATQSLVEFAENTEASKRTTDSFVDAMQLVDRLMTKVPQSVARPLRDRLREVTVRVVRIGTVEEEMRYDVPYFAVEAGRPIQILLENHDLMSHNLVITQPGALKSVAMAGLAAGPTGTDGLPYVPDSSAVLAASEMVAPDQSTRITLTAPSEPGEYPYVCTFPQHWYRMYGVMIVVEDLVAWNADPTEPANPIGSNRMFVQAWTMEDFDGAFATDLTGRSASIGEKIFNEASCVGCHKIKGVGGVVGPELTDVYPKWKFDHTGILREILMPSHTIDSKYATQTVLTTEGRTLSGIVVDEDDETLTLMTDPEAKEPMVIAQDDIEVIKRSATSMMPKALMDQYTKDEVLELMAYLRSVGPAAAE